MKKSNFLKKLIIILGGLAALAGIAYAVYHFFIKDEFDDFNEDEYIDDSEIADLLEDDD